MCDAAAVCGAVARSSPLLLSYQQQQQGSSRVAAGGRSSIVVGGARDHCYVALVQLLEQLGSGSHRESE